MADRQVRVSLVAQVNGYVAGMKQAAAASTYVGTEAERAAKRLADQKLAFEQVGRSMLVVGAVIAAGVGVAVAKFAQFDQAMSNIKAVTQETAENMDLLRTAALDAGGRTIFTATEAANAIEELGKAGISTADILDGGLDGALSLAASGQLEVARAAEITATTLKQYGLEGAQAAHVSDVLSAGAGKALGSVEDLAQGMKFVGPVAASMGVSLEETTGALSLFADQGLVGEQAGTSLRGVLSSLTSPSSQAAKEIQRLGISLYDAQGNFLGLENVAGQLSNAYSNLDDQQRDMSLGLIFGNQQITAARVLFESGGEVLHKYTEEVNDSGYAARVAADRMDNLRGDVEKLGGAFDNVLIKSGSGANDVLRALTQTATFLVDEFGDLPEPVLGAGLAIGAVAAAIALAGGGALLGVPKIAEFKLALSTLGVTGKTAAIGIGATSAALSAVVFVLGAVVSKQAEAKASSDAFRDSLDQTTGALTDYTRELAAKKLQEGGVFDITTKLGYSQREVTDAVLAGGAAFDEIRQKMREYARDHGDLLGAFTATGGVALGVFKDTNSELERGKDAWGELDAAGTGALGTTEDNTGALRELKGASAGARDDIDKLADMIRGFGDATLSTRDAQRQFQAAIDAAAESVKANGKTLDINTEAGRQNEASLDAIAKAAKEAAAAIFDQTNSQAEASEALQTGRDALIGMLGQYGITGDAAEEYADKLGLIPADIGTVVDLNTSPAEKELQDFLRMIASQRPVLSIDGRVSLRSGQIAAHADGGTVQGPGGPKSDSVLIRASAGEEIIQEPYATRFRPQLKAMNAGMIPAFAGGGTVPHFAPAPVYAPPTAQYMQAPGLREGDTFIIHEAIDGRSTALAVQRRQSALGAV